MTKTVSNQSFTYKLLAELLFLCITALIAYMVMKPLRDHIINFDFMEVNYFSIFLFLTYTRYIFLLRWTPFSHAAWFKLLLVFASIPILFYLTDEFYDFTRMLDEEGLEPKVNTDVYDNIFPLANYVKIEFLFFLTGAFITSVIVPIRMIISIWRVYNKKEKV